MRSVQPPHHAIRAQHSPGCLPDRSLPRGYSPTIQALRRTGALAPPFQVRVARKLAWPRTMICLCSWSQLSRDRNSHLHLPNIPDLCCLPGEGSCLGGSTGGGRGSDPALKVSPFPFPHTRQFSHFLGFCPMLYKKKRVP